MPMCLKPSSSDLLGDRWANSILKVWDRMKEKDPELCQTPGAYEMWHWIQCKLSGVESHMVWAPEIAAATGSPCPVDKKGDLLALSDEVINELY